jgi:hypothetical protein
MIHRLALPLLLLATVGCGDTFDDDSLATELWDAVDGYDSWSQVSPWDGIQKSDDGTHGDYVQIWFNATAAADWGGTIGDGGISVKKGYDDAEGTSPKGTITVMYKVDGYDPDNGDWFFANYGDDGSVNTSGAAAAGSCAGCHASAASPGDYLRTVTDTPGTDE